MKKLTSICATGLFLSSATLCCAQAPPAAAPPAPAAPAAAPAVIPSPPRPVAAANKVGMTPAAWETMIVTADGKDGKKVSSADLKGKAYGIVFVNSACADCRSELAEMVNYKFKDTFNFFIAAVDLKMDRAIGVYKGEMNLPFDIIDDSKRAVGKVFGLTFSPASVIVDADGKIEYTVAGYTDETNKATLGAFKKYLK